MVFAHKTIRPAAVAGRFYPGEPDALRQTLQRLRESVSHRLRSAAEAEQSPGAGALCALIGPHAGYVFSGPVAASGYYFLSSCAERIQRVVMIGPAHYEPFTGLAATSAAIFDTPLGAVQVDTDAFVPLLDLPFVHVHDEAHKPEHALEVHLPFLIDALGGPDRFRIVPLLFGDSDETQVAEAIEPFMDDPHTLILISSDLSHYLDHDTAMLTDRATADAIVAGESHRIGPSDACGYVAIRGLMRLADPLALSCTCIDLRNSGDTAPDLAGSRDRVVGYGSFIYRR